MIAQEYSCDLISGVIGRRLDLYEYRLPTTRDVQNGAGYIRSLVRQQPQNCGSDLFRLTAALHWDRRFQSIHAARLAALCMNVSVDEARADGIDPDSLFGNLLRQSDCQCVDRTLASRIVDVFA